MFCHIRDLELIRRRSKYVDVSKRRASFTTVKEHNKLHYWNVVLQHVYIDLGLGLHDIA